MTDFTAHLAKMQEHYDAMFKHPGAREYVRARTAEMARQCPELYADLAARYAVKKEQRGRGR